MSEMDTVAMPIGAVTQLTGISGHTLRKWESRYDAITPERTGTGRRLYTHDHIRRLILLRDLIRQGHQISQLSGMSDPELSELLGEPAPASIDLCDEALIVGPVLCAQLSSRSEGRPLTLLPQPAAPWLRGSELPKTGTSVALVVELPTLSEACIAKVVELRQTRFPRVIVVYGFTSQSKLRRLLEAGVLCIKAPTTATEVLRNLSLNQQQTRLLELIEDRPIPAQRYSGESLARLAALTPKLQCECPNHIAQLLLDISAFEQYSLECEDADPAERTLHARLRLIAANARALFEEAVTEVARNEGLDLDDRKMHAEAISKAQL